MSKKLGLGHKGQSIMQLLVGLGVGSIVAGSIITMQINQQKENRSINENLAATGIKSSLLRALAAEATCNYMLMTPSITTLTTIDTTLPPKDLYKTSFAVTKILASADPKAPLLVEASSKTPASPDVNTLFVKSIELTGLEGTGSTYMANWIVSFDGSKTIRPVKPVIIPVVLTIDTTIPTLAKVVGCVGRPSETPIPVVCTGADHLHWDGVNWSCKSFPKCIGSNALHFDGTKWTCDALPPIAPLPPVCLGANALHFNGSAWSCDPIPVAAAPAPVPVPAPAPAPAPVPTPTASGSQTFLSSGSFSVPAGVTRVNVTVFGGGGGGGGGGYGSSTTTGWQMCSGAGGSAGEKVIALGVAVTPLTAIPVSLGAGGFQGLGSATTSSGVATAGKDGGESSFGSSSPVTARGGKGGGAAFYTFSGYGPGKASATWGGSTPASDGACMSTSSTSKIQEGGSGGLVGGGPGCAGFGSMGGSSVNNFPGFPAILGKDSSTGCMGAVIVSW